MLLATTVSREDELQQIIALQQRNLIANIDEHEMQSQGFVTMHFSLPFLQSLHALAPSVVVKDRDKVAGYAIVVMPEGRNVYVELETMYNSLGSAFWKGKNLAEYRYYLMGQICVDKPYRGQGVFEMLYHKHRDLYRNQFEFILTEISMRNHRSMRAHERVGFIPIHTHTDALDNWAVVIWDWS